MTPWFIATGKFGPQDGEKWHKYIAWTRLSHLKELVSLDSMLCPSILSSKKIPHEYWSHIVNEDFMLDYFIDLKFLEGQIQQKRDFNLLCVFRNPNAEPSPSLLPAGFSFVGYDLVEVDGGVSALTNCRSFSDVFANSELNDKGLLQTHARGIEVQRKLRELHSDDAHADCHLWAIFRKDT